VKGVDFSGVVAVVFALGGIGGVAVLFLWVDSASEISYFMWFISEAENIDTMPTFYP